MEGGFEQDLLKPAEDREPVTVLPSIAAVGGAAGHPIHS